MTRKYLVLTAPLILLALLVAVMLASRSRPQIEGSSCEEWAQSYGTQLEQRSLAILDAAQWPDDPIDPAYDQLAFEISEGLQETHGQLMRELAAKYRAQPAAFANCRPERFFAIVEQQFSPRFREEVPPRFATLGARPDWAWYQNFLQEQINIGMHVYENQNSSR